MLAYLQLVRLPTVFTAMADIFLGYVLTHAYIVGPNGWETPQKFFGLLIASCCLYMAGMVFNDVFDLKQDTAERPTRPIPSGRVSRTVAAAFGALLMAIGLIAAATVSMISLQVAGLLVIAILGYDSILKRTPLGPLAMGTCRFLNVLLGASVQQQWMNGLLAPPQLVVALGLGIYIVGVTVFARTEAKVSSRWQLGFAQVLFDAGIVILAALMVSWPVSNWPPQGTTLLALCVLAMVTFRLNSHAIAAIVNPTPRNVQLTIKVLLLSYVMLAATIVYWTFPDPASPLRTPHALATAALILPAMVLSRFIPMT